MQAKDNVTLLWTSHTEDGRVIERGSEAGEVLYGGYVGSLGHRFEDTGTMTLHLEAVTELEGNFDGVGNLTSEMLAGTLCIISNAIT